MNSIDISQRHDGKFNVWHFTFDPTFDIILSNEDGSHYVPKRWVIKGVSDTYEEAKETEKRLLRKFA